MTGRDKIGRFVRVEKTANPRPEPGPLVSGTDDQALGVIARLLTQQGAGPERAAAILRVSRTAFYRLTRSPLPPGMQKNADAG